MPTWHEDDQFWELFGSVMFTDERWQAAEGEVDQVLALVPLPSGADVLDLGCGVGRHSLALARRGFTVTGVDRTHAYLQEARKRAAQDLLDVSFVEADMREFVRPSAFDLTLSLWTSFSYFEAHEDNVRVLRNVARSLRTGGRLILHTMGKEVLARVFQARDWREVQGTLFLQERTVTHDWSHMENRWVLIRDGERMERRIGHWLYAGTELKAMLEASGFAEVELYGSFSGDPYDSQATCLIAKATKA
jgi:2-polyprenyl-3-methyl-5-hydroxy-6-metoxy-1,4-benzoquinol methylase